MNTQGAESTDRYHRPVQEGPIGEPEGGRRRRFPWSRTLLLLALAGPPLWLGGAKPWVIPCFVLLVAGLLVRRCLASGEGLRVPSLWWLGLFAAGITLLQWIPLPDALLELLAGGLREQLAELLAGTSMPDWGRLSVHPGQTGLELARLLGLTGLFIAAAQLSWRLVATYVSLTGALVAIIGLVQKLLGAEAIYGLYVPRQRVAGLGQGLGAPLLTSFVNPNHQSGLFLVGIFAAAAMSLDFSARARETRGRFASERLADRAYLAAGVVAIQATALLLSMSRAAILALLVVLPLALYVILRRPQVSGSDPTNTRRRLGLGLVSLGLLALALSQGAWGQLASLRDLGAFTAKFEVAFAGLELIPLAPVLGIGRGAFVDLFPLVDAQVRAVQFTHLESTPLAFLVEWGPVPGAALVFGLGLGWVASFRATTSAARRLALCGLLALAIQSCADFSLDYLGVTAAAVALAGSLAPSARGSSFDPRKVLLAAGVGLVLAEFAALRSIPASWSERRGRDLALLETEAPTAASLDAALAQTPLDPFVHLAWARTHANAGEWARAQQRAEVALRLYPGSLDAHLLAATAAAELGAPLVAVEHLQRGLEGVREPVPPALIDYLGARTTPAELVSLAPSEALAWTALARALVADAPAHAAALASARASTHPDEGEPLRLLATLALAQRNPGLALHHARLFVALAPDALAPHRLRARARFALGTREHDEAAVAELELARANPQIRDRAAIEELLVTALLRLGEPEALDRAVLVLDELSTRRNSLEARQRHEKLRARVDEARAR